MARNGNQDRALARYLAGEVYPFSAAARRRLDEAGLGRAGVASVADLRRLPAVALDEAGDPRDLVLRPDETTLRARGPRSAAALAWARTKGRAGSYNRRVLEPAYKPAEWVVDDGAGGVPIAYSTADLRRLAELGRAWLWSSGVGDRDAVVDLVGSEAPLAALELAVGSRAAAAGHVRLAPNADAAVVSALRPTVLAGGTRALGRVVRALGREGLPDLTTVLVAGEPPDRGRRARLTKALPEGVAAMWAWAPPGVRSLWAECRGGDELHTAPSADVVDTGDGDGVCWTPLGWRGTVVPRLRTGVEAELVAGTCPRCGQPGVRLRLAR